MASDQNRQFEVTTYSFRNQGRRNRIAQRLALALAEGESSVIASPGGQHRVRMADFHVSGKNTVARCDTCDWNGHPRRDEPFDVARELLTHSESSSRPRPQSSDHA